MFLFFLGLGAVLLNPAFSAWRACIHSEEREFGSRDYKIPRKAHACRSGALLLSLCATLRSGYCEGFILTLFFTALIGMVA